MIWWGNCFGFFLAWRKGDDSNVIPWKFTASLCWVLDQQNPKSSGNSSLSFLHMEFHSRNGLGVVACSQPGASRQGFVSKTIQTGSNSLES